MAKRDGDAESRKGAGWKFYLVLGLVAAGGIAFLVTAGGGGGELTSPLPAWAENVEPDSAAAIPLGAEDAPVTIVEFADYACPHCAQFGSFAGRLIRQNYVESRGLVRWMFYDYLVGLPHDLPAAIAARCAGEQERYWEMHDLLLAQQSRWSGSDDPGDAFRRYAGQIDLDEGAFAECLAERRPLEAVLASHAYGERRGVRGTPTLFLNGRRLENRTESSYEALERLILAAADSAREAAEEAVGAGPDGTADEGPAGASGETGEGPAGDR